MIKDIYETSFGNKLRGTFQERNGVDPRTIVSQDLAKIGQIDNNAVRVYKTKNTAIESVVFDMVWTSETGTVSVPHGLGFVPYCLAFYKNNQESAYLPIPNYTFSITGMGFRGDFRINVGVDANQVTFEAFSTSLVTLDVPISIKYYLFRESIV
jgi:hypothetical protein